MSINLFYVIIAIVLFDFVLERVLSYLNQKQYGASLPPEVADVYNTESYVKHLEYKKINSRFGSITASFSLLITLTALLGGIFPWADEWARQFSSNPVVIGLLFFGLLSFASDVLGLPFEWYQIFNIEQRFGFNTTTVKTYVTDKLKGWGLTAVLGSLFIWLFYWFYATTGPWFWVWVWMAFSAFALFMALFYSNLIVPLFNKQKPLEDGELRMAIEGFCSKAGFTLTNVYVIDGSKRSTKANAYFTGFGPKKRIVLYDTLIQQLSTNEIVAVLAHEIGHYKKHHTVKGLVSSLLLTGFTLFVLSLCLAVPEVSLALGVKQASVHIGLVSFALLYSPVSLVTGLWGNMVSRRYEYQADAWAASFGLGTELISGLKKLSSHSLSNLTPHPVYVWFHYSHPTLLQRIRALATINTSGDKV